MDLSAGETDQRRHALMVDQKARGRLIVTCETEFITAFDASGLSGADLRGRIDLVLESLEARGKDFAVWNPRGQLLAVARCVEEGQNPSVYKTVPTHFSKE